jgi:benzoyl-CoA reductase subunit C
MNKENVLERLSYSNISKAAKEAIEEWRSQGKKVIGYTCIYAPEEIMYALGVLPIRLYGGLNGSTKGESLLQVNICSFVRSCLAQGLEGEYDFLDGIVTSRTCSQMVKLHDVWNFSIKMAFSHLIDHPHMITDHALAYYAKEINKFINHLEDFTGNKLTEDNLRHAIEVYNKNRQLLRQIYDLRKLASPPITGVETLDIVRSTTVLPKEKSNVILEELLQTLQEKGQSPSSVKEQPRVLITGIVLDNSALIQQVEDSGAIVVADDLCVGSRYFWDIVTLNSTGSPLDGLIRYYLEKIPCACIYPREKRFQHIMDLVRDFQVSGVIAFLIKFCDSFTYDSPGLKDKLDEAGIPVLELDTEYSTIGIGQIKTRIQAFLELMTRNQA